MLTGDVADHRQLHHRTRDQLLANQLKLRRAAADLRAAGAADHLRHAGRRATCRPACWPPAIGMLLVIALRVLLLPAARLGHLPEPVLSGLLTFGALVFLGRQIGFTLTLAGIAGFIVSLGVAADSFVIYFERLKDEIREGRSPRSAVPRAWVRARRTIISANAITIMAAVVLYIVSVGAVQGLRVRAGPGDHARPGGGVPLPAPDHDDVRPDPGVPVARGSVASAGCCTPRPSRPARNRA